MWAYKCCQRPKVASGAMSSGADRTSQRYLRHRPQPVGKSKVAVRLFNRFSKRKKGSICGNTNFCIFTILAFFFQNGETHHILFKKAYSVAEPFIHEKISLLLLLVGSGDRSITLAGGGGELKWKIKSFKFQMIKFTPHSLPKIEKWTSHGEFQWCQF